MNDIFITVQDFAYNFVPISRKIKILEMVFANKNEPSHYNTLYVGRSRYRRCCGYDLSKYHVVMIFVEDDYLVIECLNNKENIK